MKPARKVLIRKTYLNVPQNSPFQPTCVITQNLEGCVRVATEYKFVKYFYLLLTGVYNLLCVVGPTGRPTPNLNSITSPSDLSDLAFSNDSDRTLSLIFNNSFPNRVKSRQARKCAHTRYGFQKSVGRILELSFTSHSEIEES